jgi:PAS domain S-box-containing protein
MAARVPVVASSLPVLRRRSLRVRGALVVALPSLALLVALATLLLVVRQDRTLDDRVTQTVQVHSAADLVLELTGEVESGVRGYLAAGDSRLLQSTAAAREAIPTALTELETLLDAQSGAEPGRETIRPTVERALRQLQALVDRGPGAGLDLTAERATMDSLRTQLDALREHELGMERDRRKLRSETNSTMARLSLVLGAVALLAGVGGSAALMGRIVTRVRRLEHEAHKLAAGAALQPVADEGRDELGSLATALHEASTLIDDQRRRLQLALEVGRINVWEVDGTGRMHMQGDRADEYGSTMEAGLATLHATHAQLVRDAVEQVRATGEPRDYEVQSARDGRWFAGRIMKSSETDTIAVSVDVTVLREAQEELRHSEALRAGEALAASERRGRLNALVIGSAGEGIVAIDTRGTCTSINPAAAAMLGYQVADLVGQDFHARCHHSHPDGTPYSPLTCPLLRTATTGEGVRVEHEVFWRADGTRLPVDYVASPLSDDGRLHGAVVTFTDTTERRALDVELERQAARLRRGIGAGELLLHYQPKVDLMLGGCRSVEALVRWARGSELVYPDAFIPAAESGGVIGQLTEWVLDAAAQQAAAWRDAGRELRIAVNLSALSLATDDIVHVLVDAADRHAIPPALLEIELTESAAAANPDSVVAVLAQLAGLGVRAALDDFGTGYSSLSYLKHLPLAALKIDKSFVMNMPNEPRDQAIVASTVHMAHSLGVRVVAEGVETEQVLQMLRRAHCDLGQGYFWSRPVEATELDRWFLADEGNWARS